MSTVLLSIADHAEALTDPREHTESRHDWTDQRNKIKLPPHRTLVQGLIQQLRDLSEPGVDGGASGGSGGHSVPVRLSATSLYSSIAYGVMKRLADEIARGARVDRRSGPEDCIRALVGLAPTLPSGRRRVDPYVCMPCSAAGRGPRWEHFDLCFVCVPTTQQELLAELRSWRLQAEVIAGWRARPRPLPAPCPACSATGSLRVYPDPDNPRAGCSECGASWAENPDEHEGNIDVLAAHVVKYADRTAAERTAARTAAVAERRHNEIAKPRDTPENDPAA